MTFNGISWGYVDSDQALPYSYNAQRILNMLNTVTKDKGNLLLNIGPMPDGSVPKEVIEPLTTVGNWLCENGVAVYGNVDRSPFQNSNGVCLTSRKGNTIYLWNRIWQDSGSLTLGGFLVKLKSAYFVKDHSPITFHQEGHRIFLENMPKKSPDTHAGITVIALEFEGEINFARCCDYPQLHGGYSYENQ